MRQILRPLNGTWPREHVRPIRSNFDTAWSTTIDQLEREIGCLVKGPREYVVEIDVSEADIRLDGRLRASARPVHSGVIISFESKHGPLRYIVDRFDDWQDNVRAVARGLEALRMVDRYGITTDGEQYTGFNALPPGRPMGAAMTKEEALRILGVTSPTSEAAVRDAFRDLARTHHPDRGGDPSEFRRIVEARDMLGGGE